MNLSVFESFPILTGQRIQLVQHQKQHALDIYAMRSDLEVMRYMDTSLAKNVPEIEEKIILIQKDYDHKVGINWVITDLEDATFIGVVSIWKIDQKNNRGEIGYTLRKSYWKKGLATEAVRLVLDFAFRQANLHSICANINTENNASRTLLQRLGFTHEAHFREDYYFNGKYLDSHIYALLASEWTS